MYRSLLLSLLLCVFTVHADPIDWNQQDEQGQTLLHKMFLFEAFTDLSQQEKVELLEKAFANNEIKPNLQDRQGYTAGHYAMNIVYQRSEYLFAKKNEKDYEYVYNLDLIKTLFKQKSYNPNIKTYGTKKTAIMQVRPALEKFYFKRTLDLFNIILNRKDTRFDYRINGYVYFDYIESNPAVNYFDYIESNPVDNYTILRNLVISNGFDVEDRYDIVESYNLWLNMFEMEYREYADNETFYKKLVQDALDNKAEADFFYEHGAILHIVADMSNVHPISGGGYQKYEKLRADIAQMLIANGADVNAADANSDTALNHALWGDINLDLVRVLIKQKELDLNRQNTDGNTALMSLLLYNRYEDNINAALELLASREDEIDFNQRNFDGKNTIDIINDMYSEKAVYKYKENKVLSKWMVRWKN